MKMSNEELEQARIRAEAEWDSIKDRLHDLSSENEELKKELKYKDEVIEDLTYRIERLNDKLKDLEKDLEDNFRRIPVGSQVRVSDGDFR